MGQAVDPSTLPTYDETAKDTEEDLQLMKARFIIIALAALVGANCGVGSSSGTPETTTDTAPEDSTSDILPKEIEGEYDVGTTDISPHCEELCAERECGTVGDCHCGTCEPPWECMDGYCADVDYPVCSADGIAFECGDDGYGGSCGECPSGDGWSCLNHMCVCTPDCLGRTCGPDLCGGSCGDCGDDQACFDGDGLCYPDCHFEEMEFSGAAYKIDSLDLADGGYPEQALDVDDDPGTCAPPLTCEGGLDSSLSGIRDQFEQYIDISQIYRGALLAGDLVILMEFEGVSEGLMEAINLYQGHPTGSRDECDWQTSHCSFAVDPASMHIPTCGPAMRFDQVTIKGDEVDAHGENTHVIVPLALLHPTEMFPLRLDAARLHARIQTDPPTLLDGVLAGAFHKQDLLDTIEYWPPVEDLPASPQLVKGMLDMFLVPDQDLDGDGTFESVSVGFPFTAIGATIAGVQSD